MGHLLSCVNDRSSCNHIKNSKCLKCVYTRSKECLNKTVPSGETLLTIASSNGDLTLATQLISLGANINQQNISGDTPLHVAIRKKHTRLVNLLLECGADVNIRDRSGLTPLHFACVYGTYKIVEKLLNAGSYPNGISDNKYYVSTPLMIATENRKKEIAELLLERGADVDKKDWWMNTAFLKAVHVGNVELVQLLLKYGANPNVENRFGGMALLYATIADHCDITRLLVKSGCSLRLKNSYAANNSNNNNNGNNNNNSCTIHFKNGNKKQIERYPPLAAVIHRACYKCFKFFLDQGVDVNESLQCKSCKTPLLYAVTNRAWDCRDQHMRPMPQCYHSETPVSIDSTRLQFAKELIDRGSLLRPVWEGVVWQMRSFYVLPADCDALSLLISAMGFIHKENFKVETFYRTLVLSCQWNAMWLLYCSGLTITDECRQIASKFRANHLNPINRYNIGAANGNLAPYIDEFHLHGEPSFVLLNGVNEVDCAKAVRWLNYWLDNILLNPRSLKNICVIKIRESLNENVFYNAKKLNLPKTLYDLITLTSFSMSS